MGDIPAPVPNKSKGSKVMLGTWMGKSGTCVGVAGAQVVSLESANVSRREGVGLDSKLKLKSVRSMTSGDSSFLAGSFLLWLFFVLLLFGKIP